MIAATDKSGTFSNSIGGLELFCSKGIRGFGSDKREDRVAARQQLCG